MVVILIINIVSSFIVFNGCDKKQESVIKIGAVLPLTGKSAQYGNWIKNAIDLGVGEVNSSGGINGYQLKVIYEDDQANPKIASNVMEKLVNIEKVPVVIGSWASAAVLAQAPIAERNKIILMGIALSPKIKDAGDFIFRIQPDAKFYLKPILPLIFDSLKLKTAAILYINNEFGVDQADYFKKKYQELGGKIVFEDNFVQGVSDFRNVLTKMKRFKPEAVFVPCYTEVGFVLKQARELNIKTQFVASVPFENPQNLEIAGETAEGVIYPYHYIDGELTDKGKLFVEKYTEQYSEPPEGFAILGYEAIKIIAEKLKSCGTDTDCIKNELYKTKNFQGLTGPIGFDSYGEVNMPIFIKTVKNGNFVKY